MSNPAVKKLCRTTISGASFWMDDNIGESIHIHLGDMRIDLTNKQFEQLYTELCNAINALVDVKGFDCNNINPVYFQYMLWKDIIHLEKIEFDTVYLGDMLCPVGNRFKLLPNSRAVKALNGDPSENNGNRVSHHINQTSQNRLDIVFESIRENGYPFNNEYIIMYGDDNIIRDGQHRAACLLQQKGNIEVQVIRLKFDNYTTPNIRMISKEQRNSKKMVSLNILKKLKHPLKICRFAKKAVHHIYKKIRIKIYLNYNKQHYTEYYKTSRMRDAL